MHNAQWKQPKVYQGGIKLPKVVRGHATYIDGKMLNTICKFLFGIQHVQWHKHNCVILVPFLYNCKKGWHPICSICLQQRLSVPLPFLGYRRLFSDRVGICRAVVESGECLSCFQRYIESGLLPPLVSYHDWNRRSFFAKTAFHNVLPKSVALVYFGGSYTVS